MSYSQSTNQQKTKNKRNFSERDGSWKHPDDSLSSADKQEVQTDLVNKVRNYGLRKLKEEQKKNPDLLDESLDDLLKGAFDGDNGSAHYNPQARYNNNSHRTYALQQQSSSHNFKTEDHGDQLSSKRPSPSPWNSNTLNTTNNNKKAISSLVAPQENLDKLHKILIQDFAKLPTKFQDFIVSSLNDKFNNERDVYLGHLYEYIDTQVEPARKLLQNKEMVAFKNVLTAIGTSGAILLVLKICEQEYELRCNPILVEILLPLLAKTKDYDFIPITLYKIVGVAISTIAKHIHDKKLLAPAGFFIISIKFHLAGSMKLALESQTQLDEFITALETMQFEKKALQVIEERGYMNFTAPVTLDFIAKLHGVQQYEVATIISKLQLTTYPTEQELKQMLQIFTDKPFLCDLLFKIPKIELTLSSLLNTLQLLKNADNETIETVLSTKEPNQWRPHLEKIQSTISSEKRVKMSYDKIELLYNEFTTNADKVIPFDRFIELSERADKLFDYYQHDPYQAMVVGVIVSFDNFNILSSLPPGSGKSWILLMLALYYQPLDVLIVVPNQQLEQQLKIQLGSYDGAVSIRHREAVSSFTMPEGVILVDECDEFFSQYPYNVVKEKNSSCAYNIAGIWDLCDKQILIGLSATSSTSLLNLLTASIKETKLLPFKGEFTDATGFDSLSVAVEPVKRIDGITDAVINKVDALYELCPIICFIDTPHQEEYLKNHFISQGYRVFQLHQLRELHNQTKGVLILQSQYYRGLDTKFAMTAQVLIACEVHSIEQLFQMIGRGCRSRGQCLGIYFSYHFDNSQAFMQSLKIYQHERNQQLKRLLPCLRLYSKWASQHKNRVGEYLFTQQERQTPVFSYDDFFTYINNTYKETGVYIAKALEAAKRAVAQPIRAQQ